MKFLCFILMILNLLATIGMFFGLKYLQDEKDESVRFAVVFILLFGFNTFYMMQSL